MIDPEGRLAKLYVTQQSYAAVGQFGRVLARRSRAAARSPARSARTCPTRGSGDQPRPSGQPAPRGAGRRSARGAAAADGVLCHLGPGGDEPGRAAPAAQPLPVVVGAPELPALTAVDEGGVEPSPAALPSFSAACGRKLSYPVAVDGDGRVADGYEVQGQPWFVLTSPSGQILWYWEVSSSGWLSPKQLADHVRAALVEGAQGADRRGAPPSALGRLPGAAGGASPAVLEAARVDQRADPAARGAARATRWSSTPGRPGARRAVRSSDCSPTPRRATAGGSRSSAPTPTTQRATPSRSSPSIRSAIPATRPASTTCTRWRSPGAADDDLHRLQRQGRLRAHRPVRLPGDARLRHRDVREVTRPTSHSRPLGGSVGR